MDGLNLLELSAALAITALLVAALLPRAGGLYQAASLNEGKGELLRVVEAAYDYRLRHAHVGAWSPRKGIKVLADAGYSVYPFEGGSTVTNAFGGTVSLGAPATTTTMSNFTLIYGVGTDSSACGKLKLFIDKISRITSVCHPSSEPTALTITGK